MSTIRIIALVSILFVAALPWVACSTVSESSEIMSSYQDHPGTSPMDPDLQQRLHRSLVDLGSQHDLRSRHIDAEGRPLYVNRLIEETSPYLRQHAHNPVNWYPWGKEALERARSEDRPIFLSIGYSTCHWCHVMEEESFDDPEVAEILNRYFVPIKVDRELRPDLDEIYMTAVQLTTGRGGWPMSSFLTTSGQPFFGGTYFPRESFLTLLRSVHQAWVGERGKIEQTASQITAAVGQVTGIREKGREMAANMPDRARDVVLSRSDRVLGGLTQGAPRFPHEAELLFLLERAWRDGDAEAGSVATGALTAMARGGIHDHLGGGFHRYSTDAQWLVPHFEKMLYNQALLGRAYARAAALTGDAYLAHVARGTLDYVLRELVSPDGGFYSATDADSEGEEGTFFVWTPEQIRNALTSEESKLALEIWGVTEQGNFEGKNVLHLPSSLEEVAETLEISVEELMSRLDPIREKLRTVREARPHPLLDDKILTAWNGLMVTALAEAGDLLREPRYGDAAIEAGEAIWGQLRSPEGDILRAKGDELRGGLEDHAYVAEAFLTIYDSTGDGIWLGRARDLVDRMVANLWDQESGGFYLSDAPDLFARPKSPTDGALPSGNGVATQVLGALALRTGEESYRDRARSALTSFGAIVEQSPAAYVTLLRAAQHLAHGETGPRSYSTEGAVAASAALERIGNTETWQLRVELDIAEGWHVNSHEPIQEALIPTALEIEIDGWRLVRSEYPEGREAVLAFADEKMRIYSGQVELVAYLERVAGSAPRIVPARLTLQACDDRRCLRPETLILEVPSPL